MEYSVEQPPTLSLRASIWISIPIGAVIVAIISANYLFLNYVHVFTAVLWTGTDIFMAFLLGPILRNVSLSTRREVVTWLMPKMIFFMPTVASVTKTAGYFLASKMGLVSLDSPTVYWISNGVNNCVCDAYSRSGDSFAYKSSCLYRAKKCDPDMIKIQKLMRIYVRVVAVQAVLQFVIIFIMANFATGYYLKL